MMGCYEEECWLIIHVFFSDGGQRLLTSLSKYKRFTIMFISKVGRVRLGRLGEQRICSESVMGRTVMK